MILAATLRPVYLGLPAGPPDFVTIDDNADPLFLAAVKHAFGGLGFSPTGRKLTIGPQFADSKRELFLQVADIVCGAVAAHLDGRSDWFNLIARHGEGPDTGNGPGVTCW